MAKITKVVGNSCLKYIKKDIAIVSRFLNKSYQDFNNDLARGMNPFGFKIKTDNTGLCLAFDCAYDFGLVRFTNDKSKRIIGVVVDEYDDGGIKVKVLSNEQYFSLSTYKGLTEACSITGRGEYVLKSPLGDEYVKKSGYNLFPEVSAIYPDPNTSTCILESNSRLVSYDSMVDFEPNVNFELNNAFNHERIQGNRVTRDINDTLVIGEGITTIGFNMVDDLVNNPLSILAGDIYSWCVDKNIIGYGSMPGTFPDSSSLLNFEFELADVPCVTTNFVTIPYNLILTHSEQQANSYLDSGVLPADAFLYPLDWEDMPKYNVPDDDDDDGGSPTDDGRPDRDVDDTPLVTPSIVPTMLNANNVYWIGVGRFGMFLTWFWYDIQQFSILDPTTWDNILDNINGLYSNLASAVISVRYFPIKPLWVGGLGNRTRIKLGQVEQDGDVDTISTSNKPIIREIGHIKIDNSFNSFLDYPPYSELVLYLPYYGYVNLDIDLFTGHSLYVKATYDILSGTITYYLYYDNMFMVNSYTCKMCVDVPITLQSSYDRDRTIQSNVATSLSGFMSAGAGALTGNPIGMTLGINALNSSVAPQNTTPIKVEGMFTEQGSLYAPSKCAIILRRPVTTRKGSAFAKCNGFLYCKTETLNSIDGLTICKNPRIHFNGTEYYDEQDRPTGKMILPLESEIEEIYDYLEKGVII